MQLTKKPKLAFGKALDQSGLERLINAKVRDLLGYEKLGGSCTENAKLKWCGKKRDHVDEILLRECQQEEAEWTNYDRDELIVKNELTEEIMNVLMVETAQVFQGVLDRRAARLC